MAKNSQAQCQADVGSCFSEMDTGSSESFLLIKLWQPDITWKAIDNVRWRA